MRNLYVITYDITNDKRRNKVFKVMQNYGEHVQYSVFVCELNAGEKEDLINDFDPLINHSEDQILIINLGKMPEASKHLSYFGLKFEYASERCKVF